MVIRGERLRTAEALDRKDNVSMSVPERVLFTLDEKLPSIKLILGCNALADVEYMAL